jgi:hypothetical protein
VENLEKVIEQLQSELAAIKKQAGLEAQAAAAAVTPATAPAAALTTPVVAAGKGLTQAAVPATPVLVASLGGTAGLKPAEKPQALSLAPVTESAGNPLSAQVSAPTPPAQEKTHAAAESSPTAATSESQKASDLLQGTTVNILLDGYYEYNFNDPIGRVNLLRAYDISSNAFSLNQADVVVENAPDVAHDKRYGLRLDLQFGQATETLQGNAVNEPRPNIYRNIFQAYGT